MFMDAMIGGTENCTICGSPIVGDMKQIYIAKGKAVICAECKSTITMIAGIEDTQDKKRVFDEDCLRPIELKQILDEYVVGQERAKKVLATAVYNHYKRVNMDDCCVEKSNILLIGPTGCGKTYLIKSLSKILDLPLATADSTSLTEAGYIGDDVETILSKLYIAADGDVAKAEKGIVFIDEIDKLAGSVSDRQKEVGKKGVQQALLRLLEDTEVEVPINNKSSNPLAASATVRMRTRNILFVCGGAFPDVEDIIRRRLGNRDNGIGFEANLNYKDKGSEYSDDVLQYVTSEDLREFGMIPEFLGRLPVITTLEPMSVALLKNILTVPRNAIVTQYKKLMEVDNINLVFEDSALEYVAEKAMEKGTGARSLRAILEDVLLDVMYEMPSAKEKCTVTITRELIEGKGQPSEKGVAGF